MYDFFLAQLLILGTNCIGALRFLFTKKARIDPLSLLAPLALIMALLALHIWGAEPSIIITLIITILVFFTNVRALFRLSAQLYVDHYSILFITFSVLEIIASLLTACLLTIYRPVKYKPADFSVTKTAQYLTGTLASGCHIRTRLLEPTKITGTLYTYRPEDSAETPAESASHAAARPIVLLMPKPTATAVHYEPYCMLLAQKGYTVMCADFYAGAASLYNSHADNKLLRRPYSVYLSLLHGDRFANLQDSQIQYNLRCYAALAKLALEEYGNEAPLFFAIDAIGIDQLNSLVAQFEQNVIGFFALNRIQEYRTSGYGFVEQSDPFTAAFLKAERDPSFFIPRYVAGKTDEAIQDTLKLLNPVEVIRADKKEEAGSTGGKS
ncbi:MAG: hypothetical protein K6G80_08205 [Treponema sp.]|nr:hypothetical protein [Treponema sp.]